MNASPSLPVSLCTPRITIAGAGPGGLLCARVLQQRGFPVTLYDLDASLGARDEGGSLDLKADSGQLAMEKAGLLQSFLQHARIEGQAQRLYTQDGTLKHEFLPDPDELGAPEIDRGVLRRLLAESLSPGTIQWGHKLLHVALLDDGRYRLEFTNGKVVETDLLIGADGAWSKVRSLLTTAQPQQTGVIFLTTRYDDVEICHPAIAHLVGHGLIVAKASAASATGLSIWAQRAGNNSVTGYFTFQADPDWNEQIGLDLTDHAAVSRWLCEKYRDWSPVFKPLLTGTNTGFISRPIITLSGPLTWEPVHGVTLLGDAAHVMPPLGQGVNLALQDAAELAMAICEAPNVDAALRRYEASMLPRAERIAAEVNAGFTRLFSADQGQRPDLTAELAGYGSTAETGR